MPSVIKKIFKISFFCYTIIGDNMNSIDDLDKLKNIMRYLKYIILLVIIIVILLLFKGCKKEYHSTESEMIIAAKRYINENNINVYDQEFISITKLGEFEGTEFCSKASGVIVKNTNNALSYRAYLKCDNYETKGTNKNKYIELVGSEVVLLNKGEIYEEEYYTLMADADVNIKGSVGKAPGVYTITYEVYVGNDHKETAYRTVIVTEEDKDSTITGLVNREEPTLVLKGDKDVVLQVGQKYREEGYTAYDYSDGKISRQVRVEPDPEKINTRSPGIYTIVYTVTNSKGKTAMSIRTITYVRYKADLDVSITKSTEELAREVTINVDIKGSGYNKIIKPVEEYNRHYSETVRSNGLYKYVIEDAYGNQITKEIEVNNIDNIPPSGTCSALVQGSNTSVEVNATDNKGISGYSYILDGNSTEYMTNASYRTYQSSTTVMVRVKDLVGNETTINCDVTIKEEPTVSGRPSGSSEVIDTSEYRLVSTKNDTIDFARLVDQLNVAQNHPPKYPDYCLSFAYYHAYMLYNGESLGSMTAEEASKYKYASKFTAFKNDSKQVVLEKVYELINAGQPLVLHVNGNKAGTSRHYVTVVGYKNTVTSGSSMSEQDLLIIDSYDGKLERMDRDSSRFMISGYDTGRTGASGYGYQLYILK